MKAKIVEGSESGHDCCFSHTVVDESKPLPNFPLEAYVDFQGIDPDTKFEAICECHNFEDTLKVMKALNNQEKIYIVKGETGEYDDHGEWFVKAYFSQKLAESHRLHAQVVADVQDTGQEAPIVSAYDPFIKMDYNGTKYSVIEIDFYGGD